MHKNDYCVHQYYRSTSIVSCQKCHTSYINVVTSFPVARTENSAIQHFCYQHERVEHHMLDTSLTNPIITVSFPIRPSLLQFNTQKMMACMPTITFSISPVYDGSVLEPMQTFNISDWVWTFPSGKCK